MVIGLLVFGKDNILAADIYTSLRERPQASGVLSSVAPASVSNLSPASLEPTEVTEFLLLVTGLQAFL